MMINLDHHFLFTSFFFDVIIYMVGDSMNIINFVMLDCNDPEILKIVYFIRVLLNVAFVVLPIGAVVMISLDMAKNVIAGKVEDMSKNLNVFIKRVLSLVCVFLVYTIVLFVTDFINVDGSKSWVACWTNATEDVIDSYNVLEEFNKSYDPDKGYVGWKQQGQQWYDHDMTNKSTSDKVYSDCKIINDNWAGENKGKYYCNVYIPKKK